MPATRAQATCERIVAKAVNRAAKCLATCHRRRAKGRLVDAAAEEGCEEACRAVYARKTGSTIDALCPSCLPPAGRTRILDEVELVFDTWLNALAYCEPGTPFGNDDLGNVPPAGSDASTCEDIVARENGQLCGCIVDCHDRRAPQRPTAGAAQLRQLPYLDALSVLRYRRPAIAALRTTLREQVADVARGKHAGRHGPRPVSGGCGVRAGSADAVDDVGLRRAGAPQALSDRTA